MPKEPLDHLRSQKKPVTRSVRILTDYDVGDEWNRRVAELSLAEAQAAARPDSELAAQRVELARAAKDEYEPVVKENSILFKFRSIGRKKAEALRLQHPPTEEQKKEFADAVALQGKGKAELMFNTDTFPVALISASMCEPALTKSEIVDWLEDDTWNEAEVASLFEAAFEANTTHRVLDLGKG